MDIVYLLISVIVIQDGMEMTVVVVSIVLMIMFIK